MMIWIFAGAMLLVSAGFVCYRLWMPEKGRDTTEKNSEQMNKALYQQYVADLERQYPSNDMTGEGADKEAGNENSRQALLVEAQRQLLTDQELLINDRHQGRASVLMEKRGGAFLVVVALVLCVLATMLYARLGAMPDLQIRNLLKTSGLTNNVALRNALVNRLEQRQDNFYYWLMLARIELGDTKSEQAVHAYRQAHKLAPQDSMVASELAHALFMTSNHQINGEIEKLIADALASDPHNTMALELAGIAAFASRDYGSAVTYWKRALVFLQTGASSIDSGREHVVSAQIKALRAGLMQAQSLLSDRLEGGLSSGSLSSSGGQINGEEQSNGDGLVPLNFRVQLGKNFADQADVNPTSTVYVYAREWQGMPMPLVAQRYTAAELPLDVHFTDAMSLSPARVLSSVKQIEIIARISTSGTLQASTGDLEGSLGPISLNLNKQASYSVTIDKRLP